MSPVSIRYTDMTIEFLDQLTMWLAFIYGGTLFFILETPWMQSVEKQVPALFLILRKHQPLALVCLWVGALWILQDIYVSI